MGGAWSQEAGVLVQVIGRVDFRRTRRVRDNAPPSVRLPTAS